MENVIFFKNLPWKYNETLQKIFDDEDASQGITTTALTKEYCKEHKINTRKTFYVRLIRRDKKSHSHGVIDEKLLGFEIDTTECNYRLGAARCVEKYKEQHPNHKFTHYQVKAKTQTNFHSERDINTHIKEKRSVLY